MKLSERFAIGAVASVLFKFILAGVTLKYGDKSLTLGNVDAATVAAILTPVLGAVHLGSWVEKNGSKKESA